MNTPCDKYLADPGTPGECRNCGFPKRTHSPVPASKIRYGFDSLEQTSVKVEGYASTTDWRDQVRGSFRTAALNANSQAIINETEESLIAFIEKTIAIAKAEGMEKGFDLFTEKFSYEAGRASMKEEVIARLKYILSESRDYMELEAQIMSTLASLQEKKEV